MTDRALTDAKWHELRGIVWNAFRVNFLKESQARIDVFADIAMHALDDHLRLESVNADLLEALRPFARTNVIEPSGLIVGLERLDFERARKAISKAEKSNG